LIVSKFEDTCYLRICNVRVAPQAIGSFIVYVCITGPFIDVGKLLGNLFKEMFFSVFFEVWLKVTYGALIWGLFHGGSIIPMKIIRGGMGFHIWVYWGYI
jgi:hypothetical protein